MTTVRYYSLYNFATIATIPTKGMLLFCLSLRVDAFLNKYVLFSCIHFGFSLVTFFVEFETHRVGHFLTENYKNKLARQYYHKFIDGSHCFTPPSSNTALRLFLLVFIMYVSSQVTRVRIHAKRKHWA